MHSVEQCDSAANARTHANPVSTRVCTPQYYDTQQVGVYSTPSKNILGARSRARTGVLGTAGGRLRRSCVFEKSRGFRHVAPRYWFYDRGAARSSAHAARPIRSERRTSPHATALIEILPMTAPQSLVRSRPCYLAQGLRRSVTSRAARRDAEFFRGHRPSDTFRDTKRTTSTRIKVVISVDLARKSGNGGSE